MINTSLSITNIIIGITAVISIYAFFSPELMHKWIFSPYETRYNKQYYRFITGGVIHANWLHLFLNMFVLSMFGGMVEEYFRDSFYMRGIYYYIMLYLGALVVSNLPSYFKYHNDPAYQSLGASGAVSAVLFSYILIDPFATVYFMGLVGLPAWVFGIAYFAYEYWAGKRQMDNVSHDAHLMGAVYGILFSILVKPSLVTDLVHRFAGLF